MCGLIGGNITPEQTVAGLQGLNHRGPDAAGSATAGPWTLGHTRLAIQDLTHASDQPVHLPGTVVTYNGEQWHPDRLRALIPGYDWQTTGDTEPVAVAVAMLGANALPMLDGQWALAWVDEFDDLHLARDAYGEVPLHYGLSGDRFCYASEVATLLTLGCDPASVQWLPPGHHLRISPDGRGTLTRWDTEHDLTPVTDDHDTAAARVRTLLTDGVLGRMTSDRPVAALLSGGLDSSIICALLVQAGHHIEAYTAVHDPRSPDLTHARIVASHLGIRLHEVPVPAPTATDLSRLVAAIEMPHKAQVEIAVACDRLAARLHSDGHPVVLTGEGSDELWASYGMDYHGIKQHGWHQHRYRTFTGQHRKNFARTNKVFMGHSVEARLPFLHPPLVRYALRLPQPVVRQGHLKGVLVTAADGLLPPATAHRAKMAFQTAARLDKAAADTVDDPAAFYRAEYRRHFRGARP